MQKDEFLTTDLLRDSSNERTAGCNKIEIPVSMSARHDSHAQDCWLVLKEQIIDHLTAIKLNWKWLQQRRASEVIANSAFRHRKVAGKNLGKAGKQPEREGKS